MQEYLLGSMMSLSLLQVYGPLFHSLFLAHLWEGFAYSIPDHEALVVLRVQVLDNSDRSPLVEAAVGVWGNHSSLASNSTTGEDGVVTVTFPYHPGTWVIVSAAKRGFVTNSAPWRAGRIPLYASVSLCLFPERPATLTVYEDMLQVLLGAPGGRRQAWVQLRWRALPPGLNSSRTELSASLTTPHTQSQLGGFPYPFGLDLSLTGSSSSWVELTAVAAVSVHLSMRNGSRVQVREPVHISIPLPSDSPLNAATSAPLWRLQDTTGLWVRSGSAFISKDGDELTWSFVAPQLGYWLAAFPSATGLGAGSEFSFYRTVFLLSILGSMALVVLVLLCLLLYYCRRRCLKPRQRCRKLAVSCQRDQCTSTVREAGRQRDQCTSTSPLQLISSAHLDVHARRYHDNHPAGGAEDDRGRSSTPPASQDGRDPSRPPDYSAPTLTSTQPGQLVICHSLEQMRESMYGSLVPTLVIPAHYMSLTPDLPGLAGLWAVEQDREGIQASLTLPRTKPTQRVQDQKRDSEGHGAAPVRFPVLFNDSAMAQVSGELQALTDSRLLELGVKPHPQAWFVSLDGQSNSLVRNSYMEQSAGAGAGPEKNKNKKGDTGRIHSQAPCITSAKSSSGQAQERSSLTPDPDNHRGTFPRPRRCTDPTTTSPEERPDDRDEDGESKKSLWQKREERPLIVFK